MFSVSSKQISELGPTVLQIILGDHLLLQFSNVLPAENANHESLVFASDIELIKTALEKNVKGLIIKETLSPQVKDLIPEDCLVWTTPNIQWAMSQVLQLFDRKTLHLKNGIHPLASIHPTAVVHPSAHIGAFAVIEAHAQVGADTIIYPHVYLGSFCEVGARCIISANTTLGSDGFGFYSNKQYQHFKIPQIGKVIIEDDVEIGSQCAIDRATLTETRIKKGTKLDNFCHIAHNVEIGENSMITAGFIVAGSTKIGRHFTTAGGVHVNGHINITDNVVLTGRAAASNDVTKPGIYGGFPLEPHRESVKTLVSLPQIKVLRKQVNKILKHLNLTNEDN